MTIELWCVVAASLLTLLLAQLPVLGRTREAGVTWNVGNRDAPFAGSPWIQRGDRAYANHMANLTPFVAVVLVAHVSGQTSSLTAACCVTFVIARVVYALVYLLGVTWVRTLAFLVGLAATVVLAATLA